MIDAIADLLDDARCNYVQEVYVTAFFAAPMTSSVYVRARRLEKRFGRPAGKYLDDWGRFQHERGISAKDHPEAQPMSGYPQVDTFPAHVRARRTEVQNSTPHGDSIDTK